MSRSILAVLFTLFTLIPAAAIAEETPTEPIIDIGRFEFTEEGEVLLWKPTRGAGWSSRFAEFAGLLTEETKLEIAGVPSDPEILQLLNGRNVRGYGERKLVGEGEGSYWIWTMLVLIPEPEKT